MKKHDLQCQWGKPCEYECRYKCGRRVPVHQMTCGYCAIAEMMEPEILHRIARTKEKLRKEIFDENLVQRVG